VDTCTVTAPDAITAFAVPNPNCSSQKQSVFSGLATQRVASSSESPSLLWTNQCNLINPFSRRQLLRSHQRRPESMPQIGAFPVWE
jgi:hypothetical protein